MHPLWLHAREDSARGNKKSPENQFPRADIQSIEQSGIPCLREKEYTGLSSHDFSSFIQTLLSVPDSYRNQPHNAGRGLVCSRSFTAGRELHPTLKNFTFMQLPAGSFAEEAALLLLL